MKIGVVVDWERGTRCNNWDALLKELDTDKLLLNEASFYSVADLIVAHPDDPKFADRGFFLRDLDVLVINWDVANGDPEFGSHLALRWLEHRYREILLWIRTGKLLIIEGQAVLSVPCQQAYDALAGMGELPVCGPEDPQNPGVQIKRLGDRCRKTRYMPSTHGFDNVPVDIRNNAVHGPTHDFLFPGASSRFLTKAIYATPWHKIIYRGWFRRVVPGTRNLPWVSIIKTADRSFLKNHSTMKVAKAGEGAIFATTMFLATTNQRQLVMAMLNCAHKNTRHLPDPPSYVALLKIFCKSVLTLFAGVSAGYLSRQYGQWTQRIIETLHPGLPQLDQETLRTLIEGGFVAAGMGLVILSLYLLKKTRKWVRDIMGY